MPSPAPQPIDAATARRVEQSLADSRRRMDARQRRVETVSALLSILAATALALLAGAGRAFDPLLAAAFVACYAGMAGVAFNVGAGYVSGMIREYGNPLWKR